MDFTNQASINRLIESTYRMSYNELRRVAKNKPRYPTKDLLRELVMQDIRQSIANAFMLRRQQREQEQIAQRQRLNEQMRNIPAQEFENIFMTPEDVARRDAQALILANSFRFNNYVVANNTIVVSSTNEHSFYIALEARKIDRVITLFNYNDYDYCRNVITQLVLSQVRALNRPNKLYLVSREIRGYRSDGEAYRGAFGTYVIAVDTNNTPQIRDIFATAAGNVTPYDWTNVIDYISHPYDAPIYTRVYMPATALHAQDQRRNLLVGFIGYPTAIKGDMNCLVKLVKPFVPTIIGNGQKFQKLISDKVHGDNPCLVDLDFADKIGKLAGIAISYYTPFAKKINKPTITVGRGGNKKVLKVLVQNQHAQFNAPDHIDQVAYHENIEHFHAMLHDPRFVSYHNVIDAAPKELRETPWSFSRDNITSYITVTGLDKPKTILNKFLRPSMITGRKSDDKNRIFFSKVKPEDIFFTDFVNHYNVKAPPEFIKTLARKCASPFGTIALNTLEKNLAGDRHVEYIEIDHNASYPSFQYSPYYVGLPMGNFTMAPISHAKLAQGPIDNTAELKPAFLVVANMTLRQGAPKRAEIYLKTLKIMHNDLSVITYSEYLAWSTMFDIEVTAAAYASFEQVDIYGQFSKIEDRIRESTGLEAPGEPYYDPVKDYVKQIRNRFVGRLVMGGLANDMSKEVFETSSRVEFETMLKEIEQEYPAEIHGHPFVEEKVILNDPDASVSREKQTPEAFYQKETQSVFTIKTRADTKRAKFPHLYAYIIALSRLAIIDKVVELEMLTGEAPAQVRVDAIFVKAKYIDLIPTTSRSPHEFKVVRTNKHLYPHAVVSRDLRHNSDDYSGVYSSYPLASRVCVTGPGGVGKSYHAVRFQTNRAIYFAPSYNLRGKLRADLAVVNETAFHKSEAYCIQKLVMALDNISNDHQHAEYIKNMAQFSGTLLSHQFAFLHKIARMDTIFIDEFTKTDGAQLAKVLAFAQAHRINVIMLGDYNQTIFSQSAIRATRDQLVEWNFNLFTDPRCERAEGKPARHMPDWGRHLDSLAELTPDEQLHKIFEWNESHPNKVKITSDLAIGSHIYYCGTWARINEINTQIIERGLITKVRSIKDGSIMPYEPTMANNIWNKASFTEKKPTKQGRGATKQYNLFHAVSIDCVQGDTIDEETQYVDFASLKGRHGGFYTAITRSKRPEQLTIVVA
jgi:hypothetical protein